MINFICCQLSCMHKLSYTVKIAVAEGKVECVADNKLLTRILLSWYGTKTT